jgi:hypothetical protein
MVISSASSYEACRFEELTDERDDSPANAAHDCEKLVC